MVLLGILIICMTIGTAHTNYEDLHLHLTILHTTDVSSRFEQFDSRGNNCSEALSQAGRCYGGVARRGTAINKVRSERDDINVLLLDAGDQFIGTWFNFFQGRATSYFMNLLGYDVMTFGNLEFSNGADDALISFLQDINFDVVSANVNATLEPLLESLFNKSTVKIINGQQVGVIGYAHEQLNIIANLGDAFVTDAIDAVQSEVDVLTSQGVNKIIVLSHQWGSIDTDLEIARQVQGVDIIVGGGQNYFHYSGCPPDTEVALDDYPIVIQPDYDPEGAVLIVHGTIYAKYLGRLNVVFDEEGRVSEWYGNPILLNGDIEQDPELLAEIEEYRKDILAVTDRLIGISLVHLQGSPRGTLECRQKECNLGNLITDAIVWQWQSNVDYGTEWNGLTMAVANAGSIRESIARGPILFRHITDVLPFGGTVDAVELKGKYIKEMLEHSVSGYPTSGAFLQVSGIRVSYDLSRDPYDERVRDVQVPCTDCKIPKYEPLEDENMYRIAIPAFLLSGGDGFQVLRDNARNRTSGAVVTDSLAEYIEKFTPIYTGIDGRITFV